MTTNLPACHHVLHLRKKLRNDDEPPSLSAFATPKKKTKRWRRAREAHPHLLHLRKKTKEWWRAKEARLHLLHLRKCWRWRWVGRLSAHCHLLGFFSSMNSLANASLGVFFNCELIDYITTWCISWVFVISLTASPPDASPGFLWSHWLHHHLMFHYCTFLYVGMSTPLTNAKVRRKGAVRYTTFG